MTLEHEKYQQPEEPLSVRERRKMRAMWESKLVREMISVGLDPSERMENMEGARELIDLLARDEGIVANRELSAALGYPYHTQHVTQGKPREYMSAGYTMKISITGGTKDRVFSKPGVALAAMAARTARGKAMRAWMAEVVAMAARHPDFKHLFPEN
jgi:hypothetical protein